MKKIIPILITLIILGQTCLNSTRHESYPEYLFEISYENYAWGYQLLGTFVDNEGNVFSYRFSYDDNYWETENRNNPTSAELTEKYSHQKENIRQIKIQSVQNYYQIFTSLSDAEYSDTVHTGCDMGLIQYIGYYYSEEDDKYSKRVLKQYGDFTFQDSLFYSQQIISWMENNLGNNK